MIGKFTLSWATVKTELPQVLQVFPSIAAENALLVLAVGLLPSTVCGRRGCHLKQIHTRGVYPVQCSSRLTRNKHSGAPQLSWLLTIA